MPLIRSDIHLVNFDELFYWKSVENGKQFILGTSKVRNSHLTSFLNQNTCGKKIVS